MHLAVLIVCALLAVLVVPLAIDVLRRWRRLRKPAVIATRRNR